MANVNTLDLNVWEAGFAPADRLVLTRYRLAGDAQETLQQWSREKSKRPDGAPSSLRLGGLSEILAWFVPEIAFMRQTHWDAETQSRPLSFYLVGDVAADPALRARVRAAISLWLTLLYSDKPGPTRAALAESAMDTASWSRVEVTGALQPKTGACPAPVDPLLFDAIAAHALQALAGSDLRFSSGVQRALVAKAAQSDAFNGVELVAFPPRQGQRGGLWSEVITLYTPTYPERDQLHILARVSIRNWGPVSRWSGRNDPNRVLDVFMPAMDGAAGGAYRHTSFDFRVRPGPAPADGERQTSIGMWPHKEDQRVFDLVRRLTGRATLAPGELAEPTVDQDGIWALPRLGSIHGDDWLAGGTGVSWPDRHDIGQSLDSSLGAAGFAAAEPMTRARTRMPLERPFNAAHSDAAWSQRRAAVRAALEASGSANGQLDLYVFQRLDGTPARIAETLVEELGPPQTREAEQLVWDGLTIRLVAVKAGSLSDEVTWPEPTPEEAKALNPAQLRSVRDLNRTTALEEAQTAMAAHVQAARGSDSGIGCAILEMPDALRGRPGDPFQFARRALAVANLLPQVVLTEADTPKESTLKAKYGAAVSDCFRMLGVLPVEDLPQDLQPAALTVIQRNADTVAGQSREGHAFPLAARTKDGRLECALPDETGAPVWAPYAVVALRILKGDYGKFGRGRQEENLAKFETFFTMALQDINRVGPAVVICEGETLTHKLEGLKNGRLKFDQITIANRTFTPADLPAVRIVRTSPDPKRQPYYHHDTENTWPSGLFTWGSAARTFYGLKQKPITVSNAQHFAARVSRHPEAESADRPPKEGLGRVSSQMDEICIAFRQDEDDPLTLATLVHRLRGAHAQYDADTARPFPLHELRRLGGGITL